MIELQSSFSSRLNDEASRSTAEQVRVSMFRIPEPQHAILGRQSRARLVGRRLDYVTGQKESLLACVVSRRGSNGSSMKLPSGRKSQSITNDLDDDPSIRRHRIRTGPKR
jgi:hypothetical protein